MFLSWYCEHLLLFFKEPKKREITDVFLKRILKMIKEKYNQWRLSYQIGRIRTIGYIHKLAFMQKNKQTTC